MIKDWLDALLSRVTMYRLLTLCLSALLGIAAVLSITGYLGFPLTSLLAGTGILLVATYGSSRLFGWLFNVHPHGESSIITALILACLFLPPLTVLDGVKLVLIGVIATASKYLLAIHGRHIFNPAAIAAVIASSIGLAGAGWWIATPALLPITLVIALLILYKTKRLEMGGVFMILATVLVTAQAMLFGSSLVDALWSTLTAWPILFLGGVMLSEPLTQPPRRWQQLAIAIAVAVLIVVPLHTPILSMSPALALVIPNIASWWWGTRRAIRLKFVQKTQLTPSSYEFVFNGMIPFIAGQYIELTLPHHHADSRGQRRMFTIATSPGDKNLRFGIKIPEKSSSFKRALMDLQSGRVIQATRVAGDFILPADPKQPVLFVAGGIGITPLISFLRAYKKRDITLVYAASSSEEIAYRDVIGVSGIKVIIVTPGGKAHVPGSWKVINASHVSTELLEKEVKDITQRVAYISGPPLMVNAVKRVVRSLGVQGIKIDHFSGY